jgi:hypothetical protein
MSFAGDVVERCPSCGVEHDEYEAGACEACHESLRYWCRRHGRDGAGWPVPTAAAAPKRPSAPARRRRRAPLVAPSQEHGRRCARRSRAVRWSTCPLGPRASSRTNHTRRLDSVCTGSESRLPESFGGARTLRMKTDVSFRGPAAPHSLLATRVAGPRNPISATAWPDAAARTTRAVATRPYRASAGAPNPATGMPTVDFSVAPWPRGNRECSAALPRNDSSRCGVATGLQPGSAPFAHGIQEIGITGRGCAKGSRYGRLACERRVARGDVRDHGLRHGRACRQRLERECRRDGRSAAGWGGGCRRGVGGRLVRLHRHPHFQGARMRLDYA